MLVRVSAISQSPISEEATESHRLLLGGDTLVFSEYSRKKITMRTWRFIEHMKCPACGSFLYFSGGGYGASLFGCNNCHNSVMVELDFGESLEWLRWDIIAYRDYQSWLLRNSYSEWRRLEYYRYG